LTLDRGITIIESTIDNQDWISAGGDPDTINLVSNFTKYIEYMDFDTLDFKKAPNVQINVTPTASGRAFSSKFGKWDPMFTFRSIALDDDDADKSDQFLYLHAKNGSPDLYIIVWKRDKADGYRTHYDPINDVRREYMKCELIDLQFKYNAKKRKNEMIGVVRAKWR
jgi:hypothetical protein